MKTGLTTSSRLNASSEIGKLVAEGQTILVASHVDPDGDSIGTQLACAEFLDSLGKKVITPRDGGIPERYRFLPGIERVLPVDAITSTETADAAIVLECPTLDRLGSVRQLLPEGIPIANIDHHLGNTWHGSVDWVDIRASSVGEMLYEYFDHAGAAITPTMAQQLYTAIMTDTGRFRFESTTRRTLEIAGRLIELGANPRELCDQIYFQMSSATLKLIGKVLGGIEFFHDGKSCLLTLTLDMIREAGALPADAEGIVDYTLFSRDVIAGALLKETNNGTTRVSLRSRNSVDIKSLAARYGGGGHLNASGCTVPAELGPAKEMVIELLREAVSG